VLDAFAARATVFENAISQAPHTIPSVLQIMTSRYDQGTQIAADSMTAAELLRSAGYETVAVVENANFESDQGARGLPRGFDRFYRNGLLHRGSNEWQHWKTKTPADAITAQAIRYLRGRESKRPVFLWLHYLDPHDPYLPPFAENMEELSWGANSSYTGDIRSTFLFRAGRAPRDESFSEADRQHLIELYDAEIEYLDQSLGELFEFLRAQDLFESSLIVLTADHGESFGEHGNWTHGRSLYDAEIHIPLIIKYPNQSAGERVTRPAQAIDILPTILDALGISTDAPFAGGSLLQPGVDPAFAFWRESQAARTEDWKLLQTGEEVFLFRIDADPEEAHDLSEREPDVVRQLIAARRAKLAEIGQSYGDLKALSDEAVRQMRELGYME
jgi:arylsulfatase